MAGTRLQAATGVCHLVRTRRADVGLLAQVYPEVYLCESLVGFLCTTALVAGRLRLQDGFASAHSPCCLAYISEHFARSKEAGIVAPLIEAVRVIVHIQESAESGVGSCG